MRLLLVLVAISPVWGEVTTGGVSGLVLDPSDRPLAGARVVATGPQQTFSRTAVTNHAGYYRIIDLPPATYSLTCGADKFEAVNAKVAVTVNTTVQVDFRLPLAGVRQTITITAVVRPVQTESVELGALLDTKTVEGLPLNRRDFLQLALISAGVAPPVEDSELSTRGNFAMHANGAREEYNSFLLDGVDNNDQDTNRYVLQPSVDAIQEFKLSTNAYSAEFGRNAGGQVNVITRSGGGEWHGFGYEYLRNRILDARNFFDGSEKPKYIRNQFGSGIGGPLVRERSFVFVSFDGLRERQSISRLASVPTVRERTGDLSELGQPIIDPSTQAPFPGARIPTERISPVALKVLNLYPLPNRPGLAGNLLAQPVARDTQSQFGVRLDQKLSNSNQLALRYSFGDKDLFEPFTEDPTGIPGFGDFLKDRGHNAMVNWMSVLGPHATQSLLLGFNRGSRRLVGENYQQDVNRLWGVNYLPVRALDYGYPSINVAGLSRTGDVTSLPINRAENTYQISESLAVVRGEHGLKFGIEARKVQHNGAVEVLARGAMSFFGVMTGAGVGDLLLGLPSFALQARADNLQTLRTTALNTYVQDNWKLRPHLTLNLGVRYEYNTPPTDPTDRMSIFDLRTSKVVQVGTNGLSRSGLRPDRNNFAPRIGFAWTPSENTVVRGGYGVYYDSGMFVVNSSLYFNPPYFNLQVFVPSENNPLTLANPFPTQGGFTPAPSLNSLSPDITTSYLQSWNLAVQRNFGRLGSLTAAYGGSKGTHLIRSRDLNQPRPAPGDLVDRAPYPQFGNILFIESAAASSYHSLQVTYSRPLASNLSMLAVYTLSKSIDDTSAFLGTKADRNFPQDSSNFHAERALSSFDVHHRAVVAWVYRMPGKSPWTRDFEVSGIVTAQSGQPFTPILQQDNSNTGNTGGNFGSDRPNLLKNPALDRRSPDEWFNTSAFSVPDPFTFGSAGRNIVRGPGFFTVDVSVARRFRLAERASITFLGQAFNLMNRANFNLPERYADDPANFGRIYSSKAPRQVQFALRLAF